MLKITIKIEIYLFISIWNHDDHGKLFLYNTYEYKKNSNYNPFDLILGLGLVKDVWKWKFVSLKKDIFTKDFQRTHIIKIKWW
jgi:hypothetical protein